MNSNVLASAHSFAKLPCALINGPPGLRAAGLGGHSDGIQLERVARSHLPGAVPERLNMILQNLTPSIIGIECEEVRRTGGVSTSVAQGLALCG